ncbi:hypothetical protein J6590_074477 [Homalodisca vitripennis]|nr:hypothetical protein J6590_074477 [Homalodisca vitripennis]
MLQIARQKLEAGISIRQIAREFGVSNTALRKRLKQGFGVSKLGRFVSVFNEEQEKELAEHCKKLDTCFYGLTFKDLLRLAYEYADTNGIPHPFNKETKQAGKD